MRKHKNYHDDFESVRDQTVVEFVSTEFTEKNTDKIGVVTNCVKLNVRRAPNAESEVVTTVTAGTEVFIDLLESTEYYYKISLVFGIEGYCRRDFIEIRE